MGSRSWVIGCHLREPTPAVGEAEQIVQCRPVIAPYSPVQIGESELPFGTNQIDRTATEFGVAQP